MVLDLEMKGNKSSNRAILVERSISIVNRDGIAVFSMGRLCCSMKSLSMQEPTHPLSMSVLTLIVWLIEVIMTWPARRSCWPLRPFTNHLGL